MGISTNDVNWQGVLKKKGVKQIHVKQWLGTHLKKPKTIATVRIWGNFVPIIAVMSRKCHDIFNDKWGKPTWTMPITSREIPVLN